MRPGGVYDWDAVHLLIEDATTQCPVRSNPNKRTDNLPTHPRRSIGRRMSINKMFIFQCQCCDAPQPSGFAHSSCVGSPVNASWRGVYDWDAVHVLIEDATTQCPVRSNPNKRTDNLPTHPRRSIGRRMSINKMFIFQCQCCDAPQPSGFAHSSCVGSPVCRTRHPVPSATPCVTA